MANSVNLDALIEREDFESYSANDDAAAPQTVTIRDLEATAFFYRALRKPDFQRESSEWDPKRVTGLIKTFIDGDLIPSVILWKHREYLFVIDGSHRLSALIAWVQDDYGDGDRSRKLFGDSLPTEQVRLAERTRQMITKEMGSYQDHVRAAQEPDQFALDIVTRSRALGSRVLTLQWVRGDSVKAEKSFVRINQQAATITPQELQLIEGRTRPDVIAARAIIKRGLGYAHGGKFKDDAVNKKIRSLANETHKLLFEPDLTYPIKSPDLPLGGAVYSGPSLKMVHDLVVMSAGRGDDGDATGERTISFLERTKSAVELICSNKAKSVGLHPGIYCYSWTGKHQPILFLTIADILLNAAKSKTLSSFIERRKRLEEFIVGHRTFFNQIVRKFGTKESGRQHLATFYDELFRLLDSGLTDEKIVKKLVSNKQFTYLQPSESPYAGVSPTRYSAQVKSGLIITEQLPKQPACSECGGLVPRQAISIDHKVRIEDGGESNIENLQIAHPYCNTGVKESRLKKRAVG